MLDTAYLMMYMYIWTTCSMPFAQTTFTWAPCVVIESNLYSEVKIESDLYSEVTIESDLFSELTGGSKCS